MHQDLQHELRTLGFAFDLAHPAQPLRHCSNGEVVTERSLPRGSVEYDACLAAVGRFLVAQLLADGESGFEAVTLPLAARRPANTHLRAAIPV
jgi:hypothetical protein